MSTFEVTRDEETVTVAVEGDLVASAVPAMREQLKALVADGVREVVCDLGQADLVDSSGIGLLVATHNSLLRNGGKLSLVRVSDDLMTLFRSMRLDRHFAVAGR